MSNLKSQLKIVSTPPIIINIEAQQDSPQFHPSPIAVYETLPIPIILEKIRLKKSQRIADQIAQEMLSSPLSNTVSGNKTPSVSSSQKLKECEERQMQKERSEKEFKAKLFVRRPSSMNMLQRGPSFRMSKTLRSVEKISVKMEESNKSDANGNDIK